MKVGPGILLNDRGRNILFRVIGRCPLLRVPRIPLLLGVTTHPRLLGFALSALWWAAATLRGRLLLKRCHVREAR